MKKVLIIKGDYNEFEHFYLEHMNNDYCVTVSYYEDRKILGNLRKAWIHLGIPFEKLWYGSWKKSLLDYDMIIAFDSVFNEKIVKYMSSKKKNTTRLIFWHWNIVKDLKQERILKSTMPICEHWTFDTNDARKYSMKINNQFFFEQDINKNIGEIFDLYFVGNDKARIDILLKFKILCDELGLNSKISVIPDSTSMSECELYVSKEIPYGKVIDSIKKSRCILEICQDGQSGLTARALEAMFLGKKLITNNKSISQFEFYNNQNILIIDNNLLGLKGIMTDFIRSPFRTIERESIYKYSFDGWLENFNDETR